jgi:hypothetical protein
MDGDVMPRKIIAALFVLVPLLVATLLLALAPNGAPAQTSAASAEKRIALVIGNAGYQAECQYAGQRCRPDRANVAGCRLRRRRCP